MIGGLGTGFDPLLSGYQYSQPPMYSREKSSVGPFLLGAGSAAGIYKLNNSGKLAPLISRFASTNIGKNIMNYKAIYQTAGAKAALTSFKAGTMTSAQTFGAKALAWSKALPGPVKIAGAVIGGALMLKGLFGRKEPPQMQMNPFMYQGMNGMNNNMYPGINSNMYGIGF